MKPRNRSIPHTVSVGLILLALLLAGCSSGGQPGGGKNVATNNSKSAQPATDQGGQPSSKPAQSAGSYSFGTAGLGSAQYVLAVGMSNLISKKTNTQTNVEPTGGSDATARGIGDKRIDIAISSSLSAGDAYYGRAPYDRKMDIYTLAHGQSTLRQIIARVNSGIKTPADLRGKKILGKRRAVADLEQITNAVLKAYGVPLDSVQNIQTAEINEAIEALKLGTADAGTLPGSLGSSTFKDLGESTSIIFLDLSDKMDAILKELNNPAFFDGVIPVGVYKEVTKPTHTVSAGAADLIARPDLPEDAAYQITKALLGSPEDMKLVHPTAKEWTVDNTLRGFATPLHPGAIKYFKEIGKWTDAAEKRQQDLLKRQ
ncbi:MAG: TAXI family TRAP transporter solute-binding subunit [Chloroflexi bacterium]|nr:TAXI family TRAP transporter solute-binding subunit [Chloroflexota bacterium]